MSETSNEKPIDDTEGQRSRDRARMRKVGTKHATTVLAALTIWGTADYWASDSGLLLAEGIALLNALLVGIINASLAHEWGHFSGARITGSASPVLKKPISFFMFTFNDDINSREQFLVCSNLYTWESWFYLEATWFEHQCNVKPSFW